MTPKPSTPHADQILGPYWESSITPERLSNWSLQLGKAATELGFIAGDGQVQAVQLLGYGQGALAEAISAAWVRFFLDVGAKGAQLGAASTLVAGCAEVLGTMLVSMSGVVDWAEAAIGAFEAARVELELVGQNVDELIQTVISEAHTQVAGISTAATGAITNLFGGAPIAGGPPTGTTGMGAPTGISAPGAAPPDPASLGSTVGTPPTGLTAPGGAPSVPTGVTPPGEPSAVPTGLTPPAGPSPVPTGVTPPGGPTAVPTGLSSVGAPPTPTAVTPPSGLPGGAPVTTIPGSGLPATAPTASGPATGLAPVSGTGAPAMGAPAGATGAAVPGGMGTPATPAATGAPASVMPPAAGMTPAAGLAGVEAQAAAVAPVGTVPAVASSAAAVGSAAAAAGPVANAPLTAAPLAAAAAAVPAASAPVMPSVTSVAPTAPGITPPPVVAVPPHAGTGVHTTAASSASPQPGAPATPGVSGSQSPTSQQPGHSSSGVSPMSHDDEHRNSDSENVRLTSAAPLIAAGVDPAILPAPFVVRLSEPETQIVDVDLATVRTVLEAAGGGSTVGWAAGVVLTGGRRQIVVTTDRGRGWMPPNVLLPEDVLSPWTHEDSTRWEGLLDPARVIVEYATAVSGTLTALASTHSSAPAVAAGVPFVFADAMQRPRPDLLGGPVVRREPFAVLQSRLAAADAISDPDGQRRQALWIAHDAVEKAGDVSTVRRSILAAMNVDPTMSEPRKIERLGWDALLTENEVLWEKDFAARMDVRNVDIGRLDTGGGGCRPFLVQSYATEALLALRNASPRQALLDALYSWSMLLELIDTDREAVPA